LHSAAAALPLIVSGQDPGGTTEQTWRCSEL